MHFSLNLKNYTIYSAKEMSLRKQWKHLGIDASFGELNLVTLESYSIQIRSLPTWKNVNIRKIGYHQLWKLNIASLLSYLLNLKDLKLRIIWDLARISNWDPYENSDWSPSGLFKKNSIEGCQDLIFWRLGYWTLFFCIAQNCDDSFRFRTI